MMMGKKKFVYPFLPFLPLNKTERGPPGNLPKVKPIAVYYHIVLKVNPSKSLFFNYMLL